MTTNGHSSIEFTYSELDLLKETTKCSQFFRELSNFDRELQKKWMEASQKGYFRYRLQICDHRILPGRFAFIAQLNEERATNRRAPQEMNSLSQPFDHNKFNFTQARETEFLFEMVKRIEGKKGQNTILHSGDYLLINVSPLEFCNSLLLPSLYDCQPQVVTADGMRLVIEVLMLSATPAMRAGFNSLCGFASINHFHFHLYYLKHLMLLEYIDVVHLAGPCYEMLDYPAKGFVFQLPSSGNTMELAQSVHRLTNFFHESNVAHNVFVTRGTSLDCTRPYGLGGTYKTLRVYVWARKSSVGRKDVAGFNPAICELFGHLNVKSADMYDALTEATVTEVLADTCEEPFAANRCGVMELFS